MNIYFRNVIDKHDSVMHSESNRDEQELESQILKLMSIFILLNYKRQDQQKLILMLQKEIRDYTLKFGNTINQRDEIRRA